MEELDLSPQRLRQLPGLDEGRGGLRLGILDGDENAADGAHERIS